MRGSGQRAGKPWLDGLVRFPDGAGSAAIELVSDPTRAEALSRVLQARYKADADGERRDAEGRGVGSSPQLCCSSLGALALSELASRPAPPARQEPSTRTALCKGREPPEVR